MTFKLPKVRPTSKAVTDTHTRSKIAAECLAVINAQPLTPQVLERMARDEEAHRQKLDTQNMREHAARVRRQAEAAKQVQDDQRAIADAIRAGQMLSSTASDQKPKVLVTGAVLTALLRHFWKGVGRLVRQPTETKWAVPFRVQDTTAPGHYQWDYWGLVTELKHRNKLKGEPPDPDSISPPEQNGNAWNSSRLYAGGKF
jgi:hypothetical protein